MDQHVALAHGGEQVGLLALLGGPERRRDDRRVRRVA
jgi:hypothetical protein